jgi:hypothetical protein
MKCWQQAAGQQDDPYQQQDAEKDLPGPLNTTRSRRAVRQVGQPRHQVAPGPARRRRLRVPTVPNSDIVK